MKERERDSPPFLYERSPPVHIPPDPFISFPQEYDEKGREGPRRIVKYFMLDPPGPPSSPILCAYLTHTHAYIYVYMYTHIRVYVYRSRKHSRKNLIQSLTSECRYASLGHALCIDSVFSSRAIPRPTDRDCLQANAQGDIAPLFDE